MHVEFPQHLESEHRSEALLTSATVEKSTVWLRTTDAQKTAWLSPSGDGRRLVDARCARTVVDDLERLRGEEVVHARVRAPRDEVVVRVACGYVEALQPRSQSLRAAAERRSVEDAPIERGRKLLSVGPCRDELDPDAFRHGQERLSRGLVGVLARQRDIEPMDEKQVRRACPRVRIVGGEMRPQRVERVDATGEGAGIGTVAYRLGSLLTIDANVDRMKAPWKPAAEDALVLGETQEKTRRHGAAYVDVLAVLHCHEDERREEGIRAGAHPGRECSGILEEELGGNLGAGVAPLDPGTQRDSIIGQLDHGLVDYQDASPSR